jgi:hypothetical protein
MKVNLEVSVVSILPNWKIRAIMVYMLAYDLLEILFKAFI